LSTDLKNLLSLIKGGVEPSLYFIFTINWFIRRLAAS
jgi:hypothetical protein